MLRRYAPRNDEEGVFEYTRLLTAADLSVIVKKSIVQGLRSEGALFCTVKSNLETFITHGKPIAWDYRVDIRVYI